MGAKESTSCLLPQSKHYEIINYGYCKVWKRNDNNRQTMEQYDIHIENSQDLKQYQSMWQYRIQQETVVSVYYFTHQPTQQICGNYQKGSILTQRIPYRLSQFTSIPYQQCLFIIKKALQSYKLLQQQYGMFKVRSTMIGINIKNKLKIWHHTDYSNPYPQNINCNSITQMINSIIQSVQINADIPYQYVKFSQFINANASKIKGNFQQILQILQVYKHMNHIPNSQSLPQLTYYLRQAQGWQQIGVNSHFLSNMAQYHTSDPFQSTNHKINAINPIQSDPQLNNNNPGINIYTHKEVNQLLQRQKYLQKYLFTNSQKATQIKKPLKQPKKPQKITFTISNHKYNPKIVKPSKQHRNIMQSPIQKGKIQFKIVQSPKQSIVSPLTHRYHASSIQKRLIPQTHLGSSSLYTTKQQPSIRKNRLQFNDIPCSDSRTNSYSRNSSINFIDNRVQY